MKSMFAQPGDGTAATSPPASAKGWDRLGGAAKLGVSAAIVAGVVALVVVPGVGDKRPQQQAAHQPEQPSNINDYTAPPAQGMAQQAMALVTPNAPIRGVRRTLPTEMALYAAPRSAEAAGAGRATLAAEEGVGAGRGQADSEDRLAAHLSNATVLPASKAVIVRHADYTIRPGDPVQCIPQDAQNSGLPGFTRCRVPEWVRGGTQRRGLIPPGTIIFGQIRNGVAQGQQRLGVLFTSIEGPRFKVALASPGADAMGRAGLEGDVQTFFWDRLGGVALYSLLDVGIGAGQNLASSALSRAVAGGNGSTFNLGGQVQGLASQEMGRQINRPPVITRDQALPVLITVGQDLEFYDVCMKLRQADPMACPVL